MQNHLTVQLKKTIKLFRVKSATSFVRALAFLIGIFFSTLNYGQQRLINSLKIELQKSKYADTDRVNILNALAFYNYSNKVANIAGYGAEALKLSKKLNFLQGQAFAYNNLGLSYIADNANAQALDNFDNSLRIYRQLRDYQGSSGILNNIGYYYSVLKDHNQELSYMLEAWNEAQKNKQISPTNILGNIGSAYESMNRLHEARVFYEKQLRSAKERKESEKLAMIFSNMASINLKEGKLVAALAYCQKALAFKRTNADITPRILATIYITQGEIYLKLKKYDVARAILIKTQAILSRIGKQEYSRQVYYDMYRLDSIKGDFKSALENHLRFVRINDSLNNQNKSQVVAWYQVKFESEKRKDENQRLLIQQEKNEAIISQQHTVQWTLMVGIVTIVAGLIYLIKINRKIQVKNNIIEEQNMVKDKLFSVVSHDLRSPITQMVSALNLLESGDMTQTEVTTIIPTIKKSTEGTLELLDNLLVWSKNQLQGFNLNPTYTNLRQLVNENLKNLDDNIRKKHVSAINDVEPDIIIWADKEMITIVVRNLISNAIKFTPENGFIRVSSTKANDKKAHDLINICVEDNGIGIKAGDMGKLFSFISHTTLGTANEKGTGIGLRICKDFMELNNGRIWMESEENIGSKFYLSVPRHNPNPSAEFKS